MSTPLVKYYYNFETFERTLITQISLLLPFFAVSRQVGVVYKLL